MYCVRWSNEAATVHADITADHRDVPANFRKWEEAQPKNLQVVQLKFSVFCTVVAIWIYFGYLQLIQLYQNLLQSKDVESIPRTEFYDGSTNFSCQVLLDCFLHV